MYQVVKSVEEIKDLPESVRHIERKLYSALIHSFITLEPLRAFKITTPFDTGYVKVKFDKPVTIPALVTTQNYKDFRSVDVHLYKHEIYGMYIFIISGRVTIVDLFTGPNPETVEDHNMHTNDHALAYVMYPEVREAILKAIYEGRVKADSLETAVWLTTIAETSRVIDRDGIPKHIKLSDIVEPNERINQLVVTIKDFSEHVRKMEITYKLDYDKNTNERINRTWTRVETDYGWAQFYFKNGKPVRDFCTFEVFNESDKEMSKKLLDKVNESILKLADSENIFKEIRKVLRDYIDAQLKLHAAIEFVNWLWSTGGVEDILNQARLKQKNNSQ